DTAEHSLGGHGRGSIARVRSPQMRMSEVLRHLRQQQAASGARPRLLQRYAAFLPITSATPPITLGEGNTRLVHARSLGRASGIPDLQLKVEGLNPTGSFKDRAMV